MRLDITPFEDLFISFTLHFEFVISFDAPLRLANMHCEHFAAVIVRVHFMILELELCVDFY